MTRYLLDTNIVSETIKPAPSQALLDWLADQPDKSLYISALTLAELFCGVLQLPAGRKRRDLEKWLNGPEGPQMVFAGRILFFDDRAALIWGRLIALGAKNGRPRSPLDMIVAATAEANDCVIATGNERHFSGLKVFNPLKG